MRKIFSIVSALFLLVFSCTKKDDPVAQQVCLLAKMTVTYSSPNLTTILVTTYEYDTENKLTKATSTSTNNSVQDGTSVLKYNYTSGLVTSVDGTYSPTVGAAISQHYTWTNENDRLVKTVSSEYTTILNYDANGNLVLVTETSATTGRVVTQSLKWSGDLLSDRVTGMTNSNLDLDLTVTYSSYDGKNSQNSLLAKAIRQPIYVPAGGVNPPFVQKGNPMTETTSYSAVGSQPSNQTGTQTYTYEYNAKNYPTKITTTPASVSSTVTTLEYKNCN